MAQQVPSDIRLRVIQRLYQRMDQLGWEELPNKAKSEAYKQFVVDTTIGGELAPYLPADEIRVWIKDGPAKEYARALEGVGSYSQYTARAYPGPDAFVSATLGPGWSVMEGSVEDKPMRCWAEKPGEAARFVIWGPITVLKDLIWQATVHRSKHPSPEPIVVVTRRGAAQLPKEARQTAESLCHVVGAELREARRAVTPKSAGT